MVTCFGGDPERERMCRQCNIWTFGALGQMARHEQSPVYCNLQLKVFFVCVKLGPQILGFSGGPKAWAELASAQGQL